MALRKSYSLHCVGHEEHEEQEDEQEEEEQEEEEQGPHYCDDHLVEPLPDHLLPGFTSWQEQDLLEEGKFPRSFLLDWEAGGWKEEEHKITVVLPQTPASPWSCLLETAPTALSRSRSEQLHRKATLSPLELPHSCQEPLNIDCRVVTQ